MIQRIPGAMRILKSGHAARRLIVRGSAIPACSGFPLPWNEGRLGCLPARLLRGRTSLMFALVILRVHCFRPVQIALLRRRHRETLLGADFTKPLCSPETAKNGGRRREAQSSGCRHGYKGGPTACPVKIAPNFGATGRPKGPIFFQLISDRLPVATENGAIFHANKIGVVNSKGDRHATSPTAAQIPLGICGERVLRS